MTRLWSVGFSRSVLGAERTVAAYWTVIANHAVRMILLEYLLHTASNKSIETSIKYNKKCV